MKKISIILSVLFAVIATSCVKPYEPTNTLALLNYNLTLPKTTGKVEGNVYVIQVTSTGSWEASLEHSTEAVWCWLNDGYSTSKGEHIQTVEGLETFEGDDSKFKKVRGFGTQYIALVYNDNMSTKQNFATFVVRRVDTGETRIMNITQNK